MPDGQRIRLQVSMLADIPETSIQTGGGRRWDGQRVELQVSMKLWTLRTMERIIVFTKCS